MFPLEDEKLLVDSHYIEWITLGRDTSMAKTVSDVMGLAGFATARVVAGEKGLARIVKSASFMEVPDVYPYLEQGTILLTTLYPIAKNDEEKSLLIKRLFECGVSALAIKPRRYIDKIPREMIEQAEALDMPLIELGEEANLSILANQVMSMFVDEYIAQLSFRNHVHSTFAKLLLNDSDIAGLTCQLAELVEKDVYILDNDMIEVCSANSKGRLRKVPEEQRVCILGGEQGKRDLLAGRMLFPITAGKHRFGYIYIPDRPVLIEGLGNVDIAAEQSAILFAALYLKEEAVFKNQRNFRDVFIRDLLQGKVRPGHELTNKMRAFSMEMSFPQVVICAKFFTENELERKNFYDQVMNAGILGSKALSREIGRDGGVYQVYFNDAIVVLGLASDLEAAKRVCSEGLKTLGEFVKIPNSKIGIGISDPCMGIEELDTAYTQAMSVLRTGGILNRGSFVDTYEHHRIFSIIEGVKDVETLQHFVSDKIGVLLDYDNENGTCLLDTLGVLIDADLNFRLAAELSYVHYNTVRYRANKIEQLGIKLKPGRDFAETIVAYDSWVWLRAREEALK